MVICYNSNRQLTLYTTVQTCLVCTKAEVKTYHKWAPIFGWVSQKQTLKLI